MKNLLRSLVVGTAAFSMLFSNIFASAATYSTYLDVTEDTPYATSIQYITDEGIVGGYPDGTFKPEVTLNRAELLKIVVEATEEDEVISRYEGESCFTDVPADEWYTPYVCYGKDNGLVEGYSDGEFKPEQDIVFAEALKITLEGFDYEYETTDPWFVGIVDTAVENDFIPEVNLDDMDEDFSRGEMADLVANAYEVNLPEPEVVIPEILFPEEEVIYFEPLEAFYDFSEETQEDPDDDQKEDSEDAGIGSGADANEEVDQNPEPEIVWKYELVETAHDVYDLINGFEPYVGGPVDVRAISANENGFYVFYTKNDEDATGDWGWKLANTEEDANNFLNRLGAYTGTPKEEVLVAFQDYYYIFYRGRNEDAHWIVKSFNDIGKVYNSINGINGYIGAKTGFSVAGPEKDHVTFFYRGDLDSVETEDRWGWKLACSASEAMNFLNGWGDYDKPAKDARIFTPNLTNTETGECEEQFVIYYDTLETVE